MKKEGETPSDTNKTSEDQNKNKDGDSADGQNSMSEGMKKEGSDKKTEGTDNLTGSGGSSGSSSQTESNSSQGMASSPQPQAQPEAKENQKVEKFTKVSTIVPANENYVILRVRTTPENYEKIKDKKFYFEVFAPDGTYIDAENTQIWVKGKLAWTAIQEKKADYVDFLLYSQDTFPNNTYSIRNLRIKEDLKTNLFPQNLNEVKFTINKTAAPKAA